MDFTEGYRQGKQDFKRKNGIDLKYKRLRISLHSAYPAAQRPCISCKAYSSSRLFVGGTRMEPFLCG